MLAKFGCRMAEQEDWMEVEARSAAEAAEEFVYKFEQRRVHFDIAAGRETAWVIIRTPATGRLLNYEVAGRTEPSYIATQFNPEVSDAKG